MKFSERSFFENTNYRPRPTIYFNENDNVVVVLTAWGQEQGTDDLIEKIKSYLGSFRMDQELTSPFQTVKHYNRSANALRTSLLLANQHILKSKNQNEFTCGYEIFIGIQENDLFYFASIGHPHQLIHRGQETLMPIGFDFDHSMNFTREKKLPPLPDKLLGVQESIDFQIQTMKVSGNDQFLLLSRSWISRDFLSMKSKERKFDNYVRALSQESGQPFWLGLIEF